MSAEVQTPYSKLSPSQFAIVRDRVVAPNASRRLSAASIGHKCSFGALLACIFFRMNTFEKRVRNSFRINT
jgi:hypothetical protein